MCVVRLEVYIIALKVLKSPMHFWKVFAIFSSLISLPFSNSKNFVCAAALLGSQTLLSVRFVIIDLEGKCNAYCTPRRAHAETPTNSSSVAKSQWRFEATTACLHPVVDLAAIVQRVRILHLAIRICMVAIPRVPV